MLKIYGCLRSRASRNVWLAKELGLDFTLVPVIQANRLGNPAAADAPLNTASPEFRRINPNGRIPSIDDDGLVLHESLAINLHLARRHGGPFAPRDVAEDGLMTMWSFWALSECEPHTLAILSNQKSETRHLAEAAAAALARPFGVLEATLAAGGGFVVGGRFTVADINLAEVMRYAQPATGLFAAHPAIGAWIASCQSRPAYRAMIEERAREAA
jgi:glutathione S-transferase